MADVRQHCMPNPWVSPRCDQLILVNKVVSKKAPLEKGRRWRRRKKIIN
jgi:hypothetical protein